MPESSPTQAERPALKITALPLADAARAMSSAYGRLVTEAGTQTHKMMLVK